MSNMVHAFIVMLVLLLLEPFFKYTPLVALSTIIIVAMIGIIEYEEAYICSRSINLIVICMIAFLGVVFISMDYGLMLLVGVSIIRALIYVARQRTCQLENVGSKDIYRDSEKYPEALGIPKILILQFGSPIYFANSGYVRERIMRWLKQESNNVKENEEEVRYFVLVLSGCLFGVGKSFCALTMLDLIAPQVFF